MNTIAEHRYALAINHGAAGLLWSVSGVWSSSAPEAERLMTGPEAYALLMRHPRAAIVDVLNRRPFQHHRRTSMTGEQGKAGEWVERAIWLADEMADKAGACEACEFVAKQRAALRTHLTAHAQAEAAVRGALLEALLQCAESLDFARSRLGIAGEDGACGGHDESEDVIGSAPALSAARAAIALARAGEEKA